MNRLLMTFITVAALIATACYSPAKQEPAKTDSPPPAPEAARADTIPAPLVAAFNNMAALKTFRAKMVSDRKQEGIIQTSVEAVLPDKFYVVNDNLELKVVGSDVYRKMSDKWQKIDRALDITSLIDPKKVETYLSAATAVKLVGSEELEGAAAQVYEASLQYLPGGRGPHNGLQPYNVKIWIGNSDGLPRKLEGTALQSGIKTTVVYYDYNAQITIEPPAA